MRSRALLTLGLALLGALHLSVTGQLLVPLLSVLLAAAATLAGPRLSLHQASQALVLVATVGLVFAAAFLDGPRPTELGGPKLQYVVLSGTALLTVATRLWMHDPERGHGATQVIGLLVFYACGRVDSTLYLPLLVAWVSLAWLHHSWRRDVPLGPTRRHWLAGAVLVVVTGSLTSASTLGLRTAYSHADALFMEWSGGSAETGFGAGAFHLGSMNGMLQSNEVILRIHGRSGSHLRGQTYTEYIGGGWLPPSDDLEASHPNAPSSGTVTVLEFVAEEQERLFLPGNATAVVVEPAGVRVDALGVPRPTNELAPIEVSFSPGDTPEFPPAAPTAADLAVPTKVHDALAPLIDSWTEGADTPGERLVSIRSHLEQEYTYSLQFERGEGDPVVEFMLESKLGHCEYFASGMALSARIAGIPARVVTGFRASEVSPFGGHGIVRGRDAHAWVEAYVDGGWTLVDPSPANSLSSPTVRSFLAGARDDLQLFWKRHGLQGLAGLLVVVFVGLQIRTLLRGRQRSGEAADETWSEPPPAYMVALLTLLAEDELEREPAETVESFAQRTAEAGQDRASVILRRYAALRYGKLGDQAGLEGEVRSWLQARRSEP